MDKTACNNKIYGLFDLSDGGFHPNYSDGTAPVGSFAANSYGLYDIIGNIRELGKKSQKFSNIQFKVLCEFIEDKESFDRLKELKIVYYQGYLFGKAQEFDDIVQNPMMVKGSQKHV